ncbi:MAG: hypothetical protein ACK41F_08655 [Fimbriimonadaceae bacterium]
MKRLLIPSLAILAALVAAGCSSDTQLPKEEEAKMRESLEAGKGEFDINKVPPDVREKVRGIIEAQKGRGGSAGTAGPPPPR